MTSKGGPQEPQSVPPPLWCDVGQSAASDCSSVDRGAHVQVEDSAEDLAYATEYVKLFKLRREATELQKIYDGKKQVRDAHAQSRPMTKDNTLCCATINIYKPEVTVSY